MVLVQRLIGQMDELTQIGRLPFDGDAEIERLSVVLEAGEHYLHRKLDEKIGVLPEELRAAFAYEVACREEAACGRIAMYWLLDPSVEVRLAAAEGFRERAHREIVEPAWAALVPLVRNWMPPDAARTLLDEALRETRRRELSAPLPRPARRRAEILGSIPDKWGTQLLHAVLQGGDEPAVATAATESGRGIAHAFVTPGMEAISEIAEPDVFDAMIEIPWETFELQVAAALAEGLASEPPPPPGLIDVALACGMWELRPRSMTARDWLAEMDPDGEIAGAGARSGHTYPLEVFADGTGVEHAQVQHRDAVLLRDADGHARASGHRPLRAPRNHRVDRHSGIGAEQSGVPSVQLPGRRRAAVPGGMQGGGDGEAAVHILR